MKDQHEVVGLLVCTRTDGRGLRWNLPDPWAFCPYCGGSLA